LIAGTDFPVGLKYEDMYFNTEMLIKAEGVWFTGRPLYNYRQNGAGICRTLDAGTYRQYLYAAKWQLDRTRRAFPGFYGGIMARTAEMLMRKGIAGCLNNKVFGDVLREYRQFIRENRAVFNSDALSVFIKLLIWAFVYFPAAFYIFAAAIERLKLNQAQKYGLFE
jgi:hypothetical protein